MEKEKRKAIFNGLLQHLEMVSQQLSGDVERQHFMDPFDKEKFWKKIIDSSRRVSHESTKLCLSFSKPPFPDTESCEPLCRSLEMSCLALMSAFYGFPHKQGGTLKRQLKETVLGILQPVCGLITDIRDIELKSHGEQLAATGSIWEACEKLENGSKDNKEAVLCLISSHIALVKDALQELDDAIKESVNDDAEKGPEVETEDDDEGQDDHEMEAKWRSSERDVAHAVLGLVKTAQICAKKTHEAVSNKGSDTEFQEELDEIAVTVEDLSPLVDELVASLYPPMRKGSVMENGLAVANCLRTLLTAIKNSHCYAEADATWLDFLFKAVDHNLIKVENLTGKSRLG